MKRAVEEFGKKQLLIGKLFRPPALVNGAYLWLIDVKNVRWQNRAHFFAISAQR